MAASANDIQCGAAYEVVRGDTLSGISKRSYGSFVYQPIYNANVDVIGTNPDMIYPKQSFMIPCLSADGSAAATSDAEEELSSEGALILTFNRASAPPFIINSGIIDGYLSDITEATEGRVTFVDPEVVNRDHAAQFDLVTSGQVDGAYVLNPTIAASHPLLQLPMMPMFGGSAEQTAVSLWRLHEGYLAETDYFDDAQLLGFVSAPAAHIWRDKSMPIKAGERIAYKNVYHDVYFHGLDTRGPAVMRAEFAERPAVIDNEPATYFMAHGAALAVGAWKEGSNISVMEVDNGLYTPTFSVILSNEAWAQISPADQAAIMKISGEALAHRSSAWDGFDNAFRSKMLDMGLEFEKADRALLDDLWLSHVGDLNDWVAMVEQYGVSGTAALNTYLSDLRSLEDRLIYKGDETFVDQHPFLTGGS
ncbi:MAG: LysM peptidoglycan-binding domain-containing protein [Litoreibacter sp.]|nr:LysM peptidoglycan-binding domain-containing protein [Litoreibacter sp.]